jgi:hypothetical protein
MQEPLVEELEIGVLVAVVELQLPAILELM